MNLTPEVLTPVDLMPFAEYDYGSESFALELNAWARNDAERTIASGGIVWGYRGPEGQFVGFGSLQFARDVWKDDGGNSVRVVMIPAVALRVAFQGQPPRESGFDRYSRQIMNHLLRTAKEEYPDGPIIVLVVHPDNLKAIPLYEKYDFVRLEEPIFYPPDQQPYYQMFRGNRGV